MKIYRRLNIGVFVLFFCCFSTVSFSMTAEEVVRKTTDQLITELDSQRDIIQKNPEKLYSLIQDIIIPKFDFNSICRWVTGKHWKLATDDQKQRFQKEFEKLLLNTYIKALLEYSGQDITYLPTTVSKDNKWHILKSNIHLSDGKPLSISYRLKEQEESGWKIYDLSIDGISLVKTYRKSFLPEINEIGLDEFIEKLAKKNASTSLKI